MIFYRLGQKIFEYLNIEQLFKDYERRQRLLHRRRRYIYYKRPVNTTYDLIVSSLLSIIYVLICLSIPLAALQSPSDSLKNNWSIFYQIIKFLESYVHMIDRLIIAFSAILLSILGKSVLSGIRRTNIKESPWFERGKYFEKY